MKVELLLHLELTGGDPRFVWWAESPQLPGFSAAADHLRDLLAQSRAAVGELLSERGYDETAVEVEPMLCAGEQLPHGVVVGDDSPDRAVRTVSVVAVGAA